HPRTAGIYGTRGVVNDYLTAQRTAPYFAMGDRYGELYERMVAVLTRLAPDEADRVGARRAEIDEMDVGSVASTFADMDARVAASCREHSLAVPGDVEKLVALHICAVDAWLTALEAGAGPPAPTADR